MQDPVPLQLQHPPDQLAGVGAASVGVASVLSRHSQTPKRRRRAALRYRARGTEAGVLLVESTRPRAGGQARPAPPRSATVPRFGARSRPSLTGFQEPVGVDGFGGVRSARPALPSNTQSVETKTMRGRRVRRVDDVAGGADVRCPGPARSLRRAPRGRFKIAAWTMASGAAAAALRADRVGIGEVDVLVTGR